MSDTIAAIATGNNVSAIGIIRLSGGKAIGIASEVFFPASGKTLEEHPDRTLVYGSLQGSDGGVLDKCMCTKSRGPNSYTGEDTAELHLHGSPTLLRMALELLFSKGARQALPGEFTKRAFINGRMDLTQAEAVIDLIDADTEEIARNSASQLGGAIQKKTDTIYNELVDIISHYHAVLDYPDEDIEPFEMRRYRKVFEESISKLKALAASFQRGRIMKSGLRTVILGKPNVGKSTLLNTLLGYDRAIVTAIPGTTRDTIEESVIIGGVKLRLTDTAGLRDSGDAVEQIGIDRARRAAEGADLALVLIDGAVGFSQEDHEALITARAAKQVILIVNKIDLAPSGGFHIPEDIRAPDRTVSISALTGEAINELEDKISELFPHLDVPAGEIITNSRQFDVITRAVEALEAAFFSIGQGSTPDIILTETENALLALGELTGKTVREDVTRRIFERFCVGK